MEIICKSIASFSQNVSRNIVKSSLEEILASQLTALLNRNDKNNNSNENTESMNKVGNRSADTVDKVTPLMVACDKSQIQCLQFFYDMILEKCKNQNTGVDIIHSLSDSLNEVEILGEYMIGRPMDISTDSGNTAIHYAAMSCCAEAGIILAKIQVLYSINESECKYQKSRKYQKGKVKVADSIFYSFISILSEQNSHGDSPFMMACYQGNVDTLEEWIQALLSLAQEEGLSIKEFFGAIRQMTNLTNKNGDTCLSIAVGHAHVKVLDCLIKERELWIDKDETLGVSTATSNQSKVSEGIILVSQNDIEKTKSLMERINSLSSIVLAKESTSSKKKVLEEKIQNTRRCLVMLQVSIAKLADKRSSELLKAANDAENERSLKGLKKQMKKAESIQGKVKIQNCNSEVSEDIIPNKLNEESNFLSKPIFKTLDDGTIVSSSNNQSHLLQDQAINNLTIKKDEESIENLMKERCLQFTTTSQDNSTDINAEAVLDSLCIDASMILLSPQRMAMELSPSQLDVVETVLRQQLEAVMGARDIHDRLMKNL